MEKENFTYSFETSKSAQEAFERLLEIDKWWSGLYEEIIKGKSKKIGDEYTFEAAGGLHYTKQKLVELLPGKKITWLVTESNLSFLTEPSEWKNTKLHFDLSTAGDKTKVVFTHEGLTPAIECWSDCSRGWTDYLDNLKKNLK